MPDSVTIKDLLEAQKAIIESVDDVGSVETRERYLDEDGFISLFTALNGDHSAKGVMCLWQEFVSQSKGPRVCTIQQRHRFSYEFIYPFDDKRPDGRTSHEVFVERLEQVNTALNTRPDPGSGDEPWDLGLSHLFPGNDIEHQFLQADGEMQVRRWGTGPSAIKTHYASYTLDVLVVLPAHA